jgi:hypothetical protein
MGNDLAREASRGASRVLGTYLEAIVGIPNTIAVGGSPRRYMFVVEMSTDSAVAIWGDRSLRYGYGKAMRRFQVRRFESYRVSTMDGAVQLAATLAPPARDAWGQPESHDGFAHIRDALAQPLLGHLGGDRFAVSMLEHVYDSPNVQIAPLSGKLWLAGRFPTGLSGDHFVSALGGDGLWGGFCSRSIDTRVTYPEHRVLAAL